MQRKSISRFPTGARRLSILMCSCALLLAACGSTETGVPATGNDYESNPESFEARIAEARQAQGDRRALLSLEIAEQMRNAGIGDLGPLDLESIALESISDPITRLDTALLTARQLLDNEDADTALERLQEVDINAAEYSSAYRASYLRLIAASQAMLNLPAEALASYVAAARSDRLEQSLSDEIWSMLQQLNTNQLQALASNAASYEGRGWIELSRVFRDDQFSVRGQLDAINQWQRTWAQHSAVEVLPSALQELDAIWDNRPRHIALLLPTRQPAGQAIQEGFLGAYYQALGISRDVPRLTIFDTGQSSDIMAIYNEAVDGGADLVIGPLDKELVNQLHSRDSLPVTTLALNYADSNAPGPENLIQFGLAPEDEIRQASLAAWQQGHRNAALLTPGTTDYLRLQTVFSDNWSTMGGRLVSSASFNANGDFTDVVKRLMAIDSSEARADRLLDILPRNDMDFTPRRRQDIDFIFLMANPRQGRQIKPTLAFYFAEDVPVYALPSIYEGLSNRSADLDLDGITFAVEPWLIDESPLKSSFNTAMRPAQGPLQRLRALGIDSFRLYARLSQLQSGQLQSVRGVTGLLRITPDQRLQRNLQMAQFQDGIAVPMAGPDSNSPGD